MSGVISTFFSCESEANEKFLQSKKYRLTASLTYFFSAFRYWGDNYPKLLAIKEKWDPENTFHHCHSVGSQEEHCCVL